MMPAYQPAEDVGVSTAEDGTTVYLARLPAGPILVLDGAGAVIWTEATEASADGWVDRVAETFGVAGAVVAADVLSFVRVLMTQGLLQKVDRPENA